MRSALFILFLFLNILFSHAQSISLLYEAGGEHPFGLPHPEMADQLSAFAPMIGRCDCKSTQRNPDGSWQDTIDLMWDFKYILNGTSIQDETWKSDGSSATSIRQFVNDSIGWAVTYFSTPFATASPATWTGGQQGDNVVLIMPQKAPNGMEGFSRLTFYNIDETGYDWIGEWVDQTNGSGQVQYPFWKIYCEKRN